MWPGLAQPGPSVLCLDRFSHRSAWLSLSAESRAGQLLVSHCSVTFLHLSCDPEEPLSSSDSFPENTIMYGTSFLCRLRLQF